MGRRWRQESSEWNATAPERSRIDPTALQPSWGPSPPPFAELVGHHAPVFDGFLLACQPEPVDTAETEVPHDGIPDLPVSRCAEGHEWLPTNTMGDVIHAEQDATLSLSQEVIQLLLESNGLSEYGPVENGVDAWKVRYMTQDRGRAIEATGFVFFAEYRRGTRFSRTALYPSLSGLH